MSRARDPHAGDPTRRDLHARARRIADVFAATLVQLPAAEARALGWQDGDVNPASPLEPSRGGSKSSHPERHHTRHRSFTDQAHDELALALDDVARAVADLDFATKRVLAEPAELVSCANVHCPEPVVANARDLTSATPIRCSACARYYRQHSRDAPPRTIDERRRKREKRERRRREEADR